MNTATTTPAAETITAPPMTIAATFLQKRRTLADRARDFAARFQWDWLLSLCEREHAAVELASTDAQTLLARAAALIDTWRAALSDGKVTPAERREIERQLRALLGLSTTHHTQLRSLL